MPTFSLSELELLFEQVAEDIMNTDVGEIGVDIMKEILKRDLYSKPEGDYPRTEELLNSVVSVFDTSESSKKRKVIEIKNDTSDTYMPSGHMNWFGKGGQPQNEFLPLWIDQGHRGLATFVGIDYFKNTRDELDSKIKDVVIKGFNQRGFQAY